jgi:HSP20 family molecular chaperone IbpA
MDSKNMLRLSDETEDPILELRLALSDALRAAQRAVGQALEIRPIRGIARSLLRPRIQVSDNENEVVVTMDLLGIPRESLAVTLYAGGILRIEVGGDPPTKPSGASDARRHHLGLRPLTRSIALPRDVDQAKATAVFENGKLTVRAPKLKEREAVSTAETKAA